MDFYEILAIFAGGLVVLNTLPQLIKSLKTKKVEDVSTSMFIILFIAQAIWIVYALHINNLPVLLTNGGSIMVVSANIVLILRYKKR